MGSKPSIPNGYHETDIQGIKVTADWVSGKPIGESKIVWPNGSTFVGKIILNKKGNKLAKITKWPSMMFQATGTVVDLILHDNCEVNFSDRKFSAMFNMGKYKDAITVQTLDLFSGEKFSIKPVVPFKPIAPANPIIKPVAPKFSAKPIRPKKQTGVRILGKHPVFKPKARKPKIIQVTGNRLYNKNTHKEVLDVGGDDDRYVEVNTDIVNATIQYAYDTADTVVHNAYDASSHIAHNVYDASSHIDTAVHEVSNVVDNVVDSIDF